LAVVERSNVLKVPVGRHVGFSINRALVECCLSKPGFYEDKKMKGRLSKSIQHQGF
jgi:hypothetical protein